LLDFSILKKSDLDNAAMIVITVPESHDGHTDLRPLRDLVPTGCLIAFIRPGESIATLSENQMRDMGWVKSNAGLTGTPRGG